MELLNYLKPLSKFLRIALLTTLVSSQAYAHAMVFQGPLVVDANYIQQNGNVIIGNYQGTLTPTRYYYHGINASYDYLLKLARPRRFNSGNYCSCQHYCD